MCFEFQFDWTNEFRTRISNKKKNLERVGTWWKKKTKLNKKRYNKTGQDFDTLREYNDYLESVEDIIYNLVYQIDVDETNAKIAEYKQQNRTQIAKTKVKMVSQSMKENVSNQIKEKPKENVQIKNITKNLNGNEKIYQPKQLTKLQPSIIGQHSKKEWDSLTEEEQQKITENRKLASGYDKNET